MSHSHEPEDDRQVKVVPFDALQALLKLSKSFPEFEDRFGRVSKREKAHIVATFKLIEEWRSGDRAKREEYLGWKRSQINAFVKEYADKGSPLGSEFAQHLIDSDKERVEGQSLQCTVTDLLNRRADVRVWWNAHTQTPCPGIFVENFVEALFVLLLLNLSNAVSRAVCPCGKAFTRTKTTQVFHSARCGNRDRKARQRSRERDEEAKRGTQKAR